MNLDSTAHIDNPHMLKLLMEQNRPVVAPMMIRSVHWLYTSICFALFACLYYIFLIVF